MGLFTAKKQKSKIGLILGGGGARAAYQVGVLKAIAELYPQNTDTPFRIISGTSAGSINAVALAAHDGSFCEAVRRIVRVWSNFEISHVFKANAGSLLSRIGKWLLATILPAKLGGEPPDSLLDNTPLKELLAKEIDFDNLQRVIDQDKLDAVCVNASSYSSGQSISFFQADQHIPEWRRAFRSGQQREITLDTLLASSSIPMIFPPVKLGDEYFGDGSMRQNTPISPVLHLGAEKVLVIGVRRRTAHKENNDNSKHPSISQIAGFIMDTLFLNSIDADIERLERINGLNALVPKRNKTFRNVEHLVISPSVDIAEIAHDLFDSFPWAFRVALKMLGLHEGNSQRLTSYLMFNQPFCSKLIDLGYSDAMRRKKEIQRFLEIEDLPESIYNKDKLSSVSEAT